MHQHVDARSTVGERGLRPRPASVRSTGCQCAVPPARSIASIAASAAARALDPRQLALDELRRRACSPAARRRSASSSLRPSRSVGEAREVRVAGVGRGARSSRWNVPPPAACARSAVIADDDAAGRAGDDERRVRPERMRRARLARGSSDQPDRPAQAVGVADLDGAGVAQRLLEQLLGQRGGLARGAKSTALTARPGRSRASAFVKPVTAPPITDVAPGGVVAVAAAEARRGDQEGAGRAARASSAASSLTRTSQRRRASPRRRARRAAARSSSAGSQ